jgi:hypothetical protein
VLFRSMLVFTSSQAGALPTYPEPFGFRTVSYDVGLVAHRTLVRCGDYGLMGVEGYGPWIYDGQGFKCVGREFLDLSGVNSESRASSLSASFAVWVRELREYWWFVDGYCIPWQANRGAFAGPYRFSLGAGVTVKAAVCVVLNGVAPVTVLALSNGYLVKVDPSSLTDWNGTAAGGFTSELRFWFGSNNPALYKEGVRFEVLFESITDGQKVNLRSWEVNTVPPFDPRRSQDYQEHSNADQFYPVATTEPEGSGRFAVLELLEPAGCNAPIVAVTMKARLT